MNYVISDLRTRSVVRSTKYMHIHQRQRTTHVPTLVPCGTLPHFSLHGPSPTRATGDAPCLQQPRAKGPDDPSCKVEGSCDAGMGRVRGGETSGEGDGRTQVYEGREGTQGQGFLTTNVDTKLVPTNVGSSAVAGWCTDHSARSRCTRGAKVPTLVESQSRRDRLGETNELRSRTNSPRTRLTLAQRMHPSLACSSGHSCKALGSGALNAGRTVPTSTLVPCKRAAGRTQTRDGRRRT